MPFCACSISKFIKKAKVQKKSKNTNKGKNEKKAENAFSISKFIQKMQKKKFWNSQIRLQKNVENNIKKRAKNGCKKSVFIKIHVPPTHYKYGLFDIKN